MAGASLFALLDDIATVLDDVALMTKLAAKKTAGVLGDDLALNAQQVSGVRADRELPVVWAVAKGSAVNKLILVPAALAISAVAPWLILPLLMVGGVYLCFEGVEKLWHSIFHAQEEKQNKAALHETLLDPAKDLRAFEAEKIKGAIRTDFVLSAEIIVIALGTVSESPFVNQVLVVCVIAAAMTVGVYGLVAFIVKLDDLGFYLLRDETVNFWASAKRKLGTGILAFCPWLMKSLSVVGTAAMFLVGGGILVHGIPALHHVVESYASVSPTLLTLLANLIVGVVAGLVALGLFNAITGLISKAKA